MEGIFVRVRVHADSKKDLTVKMAADFFEVWVKAPAERGLANKAALAAVAGEIGVEPKRLRIVKGAKSPAKIFQVI
jgi:hypothetical protein